MIDLSFLFGTEIKAVKIIGKAVFFAEMRGGTPIFSDISGLRMSKSGIIKQFPDLEGKPEEEMRNIAIARFKEHLALMKNEEEVRDYVVKELTAYGYQIMREQRKGFRTINHQINQSEEKQEKKEDGVV